MASNNPKHYILISTVAAGKDLFTGNAATQKGRTRGLVQILLVFFLLSLCCPAWAIQIKIATYNVQNLFDLHKDGTEYEEYLPNNRFCWNKRTAEIKYKNIARVIRDLSADIIALQEVESSRALISLRDHIRRLGIDYPYLAIADSRPSAVKCALLSRFPVLSKQEIWVPRPGQRNILVVRLEVAGKDLVLFVNHWKSKHSPESQRLVYAKALRKAIDKLPIGKDFILLGDFNSNYNEFRTFRYNPALNDTNGITGINHVLLTIKNDRMVIESDLKTDPHTKYLYNLWLELPPHRRWSYNLFGRKGTPDNIILPAALYDKKGIWYVDNSFNKFAAPYLFRHHSIFRWQRANLGKGKHLGEGFSDHLPIYALFCTN